MFYSKSQGLSSGTSHVLDGVYFWSLNLQSFISYVANIPEPRYRVSAETKYTKVIIKLFCLWQSEYRKRGFQEVVTPNIYNSKLWQTSGHWQHYSENMFSFEVEKETFALKPMNCPGHWWGILSCPEVSLFFCKELKFKEKHIHFCLHHVSRLASIKLLILVFFHSLIREILFAVCLFLVLMWSRT